MFGLCVTDVEFKMLILYSGMFSYCIDVDDDNLFAQMQVFMIYYHFPLCIMKEKLMGMRAAVRVAYWMQTLRLSLCIKMTGIWQIRRWLSHSNTNTSDLVNWFRFSCPSDAAHCIQIYNVMTNWHGCPHHTDGDICVAMVQSFLLIKEHFSSVHYHFCSITLTHISIHLSHMLML